MKHPAGKLYRGAVIGTGRMGSKIDDEQKYYNFTYPWAHAPAMIESKRVELVAGADLLSAQREDFQSRWGVKAVYEDFREMLAQEQPDIVSITTKHQERAEVILACAEAGVKIIYPTKPLTYTLAEGDAVIKACREHGSLLAVACHQNWNPHFQACLKAIREGEIGKLVALVSQKILGDHNAALMRLFAGAAPTWVMADHNPDGLAGIIGFENGIRGFVTPGGWQYFQIIGSDGWIDVRDEYREFELWRRFPNGFSEEMKQGMRSQGMRPRNDPPSRVLFPNPRMPMSSQTAAIDALIVNYEQGTEPQCPGEWGLEAMEMEMGLRLSAKQGNQRIALPLADRTMPLNFSPMSTSLR